MSYRSIAAGHAAHETPRDVEQEDISRLVTVTRAWLDKEETVHGDILELTAGIMMTAQMVGSLAIHPEFAQHDNYLDLGRYIGVLWRHRCPENVITYSHYTPRLEDLGIELPPHKILLIQGTVGDAPGHQAEGPIIITGTAGEWVAQYSTGPIIIAGTTDSSVGFSAKGVLITIEEADVSREFKGTRVTAEQYAQDKPLKKYVDRLLALSKTNPSAIEAEFGDGVKIAAKINKLIGGAK